MNSFGIGTNATDFTVRVRLHGGVIRVNQKGMTVDCCRMNYKQMGIERLTLLIGQFENFGYSN